MDVLNKALLSSESWAPRRIGGGGGGFHRAYIPAIAAKIPAPLRKFKRPISLRCKFVSCSQLD